MDQTYYLEMLSISQLLWFTSAPPPHTHTPLIKFGLAVSASTSSIPPSRKNNLHSLIVVHKGAHTHTQKKHLTMVEIHQISTFD